MVVDDVVVVRHLHISISDLVLRIRECIYLCVRNLPKQRTND